MCSLTGKNDLATTRVAPQRSSGGRANTPTIHRPLPDPHRSRYRHPPRQPGRDDGVISERCGDRPEYILRRPPDHLPVEGSFAGRSDLATALTTGLFNPNTR